MNAKATSEAIELRPRQLSALLAATIPARENVLIVGAPGVGKTDIVAQAASAAGARLLTECAALIDPIDAKGAILIVDGRANFQPVGQLWDLVTATEPLVYDIEDIGQAPGAVQAALMNLIHARRVGDYKVSDQVSFVATTNRRIDKAGVSALFEPVKSRFSTIVNLVPDTDDWCRWALANGQPTELVAFIRFRPELLHKFEPTNDLRNTPSPRTVAAVGRLRKLGLPTDLEYAAFEGAAGSSFAAEFSGFCRIFQSLPNPDLVILNPGAAEVPTEPATLYAITGAISRRASEQNIDRIITYLNRLPAEYSVLGVRDCQTACPKIVNSRAFIAWQVDHQDVLL